MKNLDLEERLVDFAISIIELVKELPNSLAGNYLASQIVRSGPSSAIHYGEAQAAESRRDFIHKNKIVLKELRETLINLKVIKKANLLKNQGLLSEIFQENNELVAIFTALIKKAQSN